MEREKTQLDTKSFTKLQKILELHKTVKKINSTKVTFIFQ